MTPGARVAAAIEVIDRIGADQPAEQALTSWARSSRFAGSKDRAAVRDHVFDVLRARRSLGDGDGRSLMLRLSQREGWPMDALFSGEGHAPAPLTADEHAWLVEPLALDAAAACDLPDWLWPLWQESLGADATAVATAQQGRASVFLRINRRRGSLDDAIAALAADAITVHTHPTVKGCLRVLNNPRRIKTSAAFQAGLVELQDAASRWAIETVPVPQNARILDYCAGGGGKALGFADLHDAHVFAHDIDARRMRDLPARAARAGVTIDILDTGSVAGQAPFDVVFCDAPCSGAGTWRRTPDAKWRLTPDGLQGLMQSQDAVLCAAAPLVKDGGVLAYATCSVLKNENAGAVERFIGRNPDWMVMHQQSLQPGPDHDGFFLALMKKM